MRKFLHDQKENIIYLLLWLLLFAAPLLSSYIKATSDEHLTVQWAEIMKVWRIYAIFLVIFLTHNFVLAPLLVHKRKKTLYFTTTACLLVVFILFNCMSGGPKRLGTPPPREPRLEKMNEEPRMGDKERPAPPFMRETPPMEDLGERPPMEELGNLPPLDGLRKDDNRPPLPLNEGDFVNTFFLILLLGMNIGVKFYFKSERDREELLALEHENLEQQLEYLKYQINPHFFMNTLNNIHALVDIEPEKAKTTIVDLSKLMRYVLYESSSMTVPLSRDIDFLRNYIKLMRLRYDERVTISVNIPDTIADYQIPPMLLITFVENAFKHGVSYQQESFVNIDIRISEQRLHFTCKNSIPQKDEQNMPDEGGVGLANVRQRLDLLFADNYQLDINDSDNIYSVSLNIPLFNL